LIREILPPDTALAFEAMRALRPHLTGPDELVERVDGDQRAQGYRLAGSFDEDETSAAGVAGFRIENTLAYGQILYIDDLATRPDARRRGHARALLDWCAAEAKRSGCDELHLDSGVGGNRQDAHRLYFNAGMRITSYHFARPLP
jgi:ribosomal protein S18 acetylase RimI-like enzyme